MIARHRRTITDLGTGDGAAVLRLARQDPDVLAIGVDTDASSLRAAAQRVARPPHKGGLPNAVFLVGDARAALALLRDRAHEVRITLPWGALLRAVLVGDQGFAHAVAGSL